MTTTAGSDRRRRRSAEETRRLLLEAGTELVVQSLAAEEPGGGGPLAHIRVQDVVQAASQRHGVPITTGALYNLWPSQTAYQVDLMFFILEEGAYPSSDQTANLAEELLRQGLPFEEIGARLTDESFRMELQSPLARAAAAFTSLSAVPAVREALRAGHESLLASARELYERLLAYGGLRIREPYELDQLITVIGSLNDGLLQKHAVVPELFEVPPGAPSLLATSVAAVFAAFCEAVDG